MANFTGSILELENDKAVVMTNACDFVKVKRKPGMFVGQQINFENKDLYVKKSSYMKYYALVASFVLLIFSYGLFSRFYLTSTVYAYFDVDINPSIELSVDKSMKVIEAKPLNDDANVLLKDLKLKKLPIKEAIEEIVKDSKKQGYIKDELQNAILVSASIDEKEVKSDVAVKALDDTLTDIKQMSIEVANGKISPEVLKVSPENRNEAVEKNISMGRFVLYNELKDDVNLTIEDAKESRVADMINKAHAKKAQKELKNENKIENEGENKVQDKEDKGKEQNSDNKSYVEPSIKESDNKIKTNNNNNQEDIDKVKGNKNEKIKQKQEKEDKKEERKAADSSGGDPVSSTSAASADSNGSPPEESNNKGNNVHNSNSNDSTQITSSKENGEVKNAIIDNSGQDSNTKSKEDNSNSNSSNSNSSNNSSKGEKSKDTKQSSEKKEQNSKK